MGIRVALRHRTQYSYDRLVSLGPQVVRLRPAPHCRTPIVSYSLRIEPQQHFLNWQQDPHGNYLARLVFPEKLRDLTIDVELVAEMTVINPFDFFLDPEAFEFPFVYPDWLAGELQPFRSALPAGEKLAALMTTIPRNRMRTVDFLVEVNRIVHEQVGYVTRLEAGVQTCEETLTLRSGSCRDSAWLLVQILRHMGLAARFVSGYLIQLKPDTVPVEGPAGATHDFTDLHAWAEVYLPGAGWVGLDPTSGLLTGEGHLPLAATPDPASAAPLSGSVDTAEMTLDFHMEVTRIHEDPRVTLPYTDSQWERIEALGGEIDAVLDGNDVRLTMGGEPTFVSVTDMEGPEWNFTAMGPDKRRLAGVLFTRLAKQFSTGPLLHYGQGKWYPGEPLPRWALGCFWRTDGKSIWHNPLLIAQDDATYNYGIQDAEEFVRVLSEQLGVDSSHAILGYEDAWYYLWKERRLPVNVDPLQSNLSDPEERARLARLFEHGLNKPVGCTLPLIVDSSTGSVRWKSGPWFLRAEQMFLIPGDSPMGFRLPLDSIPWVAETDVPQLYTREPLDEWPPLQTPTVHKRLEQDVFFQSYGRRVPVAVHSEPIHQFVGIEGTSFRYPGTSPGGGNGIGNGIGNGNGNGDGHYHSGPHDTQTKPPVVGESAKSLARTALCVEPRNGVLHIFMPPVAHTEEYLDLIAAVERTADSLDMPVRIEGYPPPFDPRLKYFKVTPDPGVIEVNLQPAASWKELVANVDTLYSESRQSGLGTEKFMLDGRHTGTGGGNHLVFGGATPKESPFLRRPDLLRSLISYWNNHPSLSFLFSGLFIGPTSQAPRVDEARHESVYELETALSLLPDGDGAPWLVDRVLRHLLVDVTGNTHRTEFCIDKLYAPESSTGRLGLVEFRAFEMPPHPRMSLTQQLLMRALIARFWTSPYRGKLVHWSTSLHDKFMLPHFVAEDFQDVLDDLNAAGFPLEQDWFSPHFEFRFPTCGKVTHHGVQLELRQAIEPWHVLGEEPDPGGTARYVDSSLERLQLKVFGMQEGRFAVACNGRHVPLHPTGTQGEFVAGVRFRAWQPPSCLHPTIPVHTPLVFDLIDKWNGRAIGGCTWHVAHPGGRNFETLPVNAQEAESRRAARFFGMGHTPGPHPIPLDECNREYPMTLDLRRPISPAPLGG